MRPGRSPLPRPARFDDTELLDRSVDLLWRDGCDAVSIRDLERALGVRAPSIYRRFHSRDELVARSLDRYVDRVVAGRIRRHLTGSDDPVAGLRSFFRSALEPVRGEPEPRGCLLTLTAGQAASRAPAVGAAVARGIGVIEEAFRTELLRAREGGLVAASVDVDELAAGLLLWFEGMLVLARTGRPGLAASVDALFAAFVPHPRPERTSTHD